MKCNEIIRRLEEEYPVSAAESWDNPGLLVGRADREVKKIFVALDVTDETLEQAILSGADLMITHHPLIFGSLKQVNDQSVIGRRVLGLIEHQISYYAMHTNFDVRGMADINEQQLGLTGTEVLEVTGENNGKPEGIGRVGELPEEMTLKALSASVKAGMGIPSVLLYGDEEKRVRRVAVSSGSGKSMVPAAMKAGAQVLVTGDVDYHTAIDAVACGLHIIDAGHYGTEYCFIAFMKEKLQQLFPELTVSGAEICFPFTVQ
ncbi:MAG: Nif3-like dinuclear metal center hexameric protein [Lachnospiraceae bacterium]|nr:Nif3-like dinuclear metal center hexameric protein [Lachnospiraceae bacterium]